MAYRVVITNLTHFKFEKLPIHSDMKIYQQRLKFKMNLVNSTSQYGH